MIDGCSVSEIAGPHPHFERVPVELGDCDLTIISCALMEFEKPALRPEHWPETPRARIDRAAAQWIAEHPERVLRLISFGAVAHGERLGCCFMTLHHAPRVP